MKNTPETEVVGEIPIIFSYEVAPLIMDILTYPNCRYSLWQNEGYDRLNLKTILTATKPSCQAEYTDTLEKHYADILISGENAGEYWANRHFDALKPWRMRIEMKHRALPYSREVKVSYRDILSLPAWEQREWVGPVETTNPEGLWMHARRSWEINPYKTNKHKTNIPLIGGLSIPNYAELRNFGRVMGPVEVEVFSRYPDNPNRAIVYLDDENRLSAIYSGARGPDIRVANEIERVAYKKARELHWGDLDQSLLDSYRVG